jgi:hypothetical protein
MWNYVYFLIFIHDKDKNDFTGIEQYLYKLISNDDKETGIGDISFFPILRSLSLEQKGSNDDIGDDED